MSIFNSMLGSLSPPPKFRKSFEDPNAHDHELPRYNSPPTTYIPPPVTSSVLWSAPKASIAPQPRVPDDLLALQRRARHLEQQLQELLDAQADGLTSGLVNDSTPDDLTSNGSTTPTISSNRSADKNTGAGNNGRARKAKVGLSTARRGIFRRIQQLASVKAEELDMLDEDLRELQITVEKTTSWDQKRARLEKKIKDIEGEDAGAKTEAMQTEASKLELEIRQKEDELRALKRRHRKVLNELSETENSMEARLSSYKTSLSMLDREISNFLARPPNTNHVSLSGSPFPTLPTRRRTLEMAREYWQDEYTRLAGKCEEIETDRIALNEGAVLWNDVVKRVADYEASLQSYMQEVGRSGSADTNRLLDRMDATITYLNERLELSSSNNWNLLVCAIGAELEAFEQGKEMLENALGVKHKGKGKARNLSVELEDFHSAEPEEMTGSAIRVGRSPPGSAHLRTKLYKSKPEQVDDDDQNDDPDPELMISL